MTIKVGDILFRKEESHYHYAPTFKFHMVAKITPTGKIRLETGELLDDNLFNKHVGRLKPFTPEDELDFAEWTLRDNFRTMLKVLGETNNRCLRDLEVGFIMDIIPMLLPLLEEITNNKHCHNHYTVRRAEDLPKDYDKYLKDYLKIKEKIENGTI